MKGGRNGKLNEKKEEKEKVEKQKGFTSPVMILKEEVEKVTDLARLSLSDEEKEKFSHQLSDILTHIDKLNNVQADEVDAGSRELDSHNVLREDAPRPPFFGDDLMANAPDKEQEYFRVPKIIE